MAHIKKIILIIIGGILVVGVGSYAYAAIQPDIPMLPLITVNPDVYYPFNEILYIEGRAQPRQAMHLQFQKQGVKPLRFSVKADTSGEWVFAENVPLETGDWEVRVRAVEGGGMEEKISEWSNPRIIKVIVSGVTLGGINITFSFLALIIVILLIAGACFLLYFHWRVRRLQAMVMSKEVQEAQGSVREGLAELRRDLISELRLLGSSGTLPTPEELAKKEHLLGELDKLEQQIQKEIRDIEEKSV